MKIFMANLLAATDLAGLAYVTERFAFLLQLLDSRERYVLS